MTNTTTPEPTPIHEHRRVQDGLYFAARAHRFGSLGSLRTRATIAALQAVRHAAADVLEVAGAALPPYTAAHLRNTLTAYRRVDAGLVGAPEMFACVAAHRAGFAYLLAEPPALPDHTQTATTPGGSSRPVTADGKRLGTVAVEDHTAAPVLLTLRGGEGYSAYLTAPEAEALAAALQAAATEAAHLPRRKQ